MTHETALASLADCRRQIDKVDREILHLLNERTRIVEVIGRIKGEFQMPVYEPKREEEVYRNILDSNGGPLPPDAVKRIFERIIDEMRTLQRARIDK